MKQADLDAAVERVCDKARLSVRGGFALIVHTELLAAYRAGLERALMIAEKWYEGGISSDVADEIRAELEKP